MKNNSYNSKHIIIYLMLLGSLSCGENAFQSFNGSDSNDTSNNVIAGSYANMLIVGDYMYSVNKSEMITFDVKDVSNPININTLTTSSNIQSLYHANGILFLGSAQNMMIYKIQANGIPILLSNTSYSLSLPEICTNDPIAVKENFAFVTLANSNQSICNRSVLINQLRVYNLNDISKPTEVKRINMKNPHGLAYKGNVLFVCDVEGVVVFDITNSANPIEKETLKMNDTYDLIVKDNTLIIVSSKNLYLYDVADPNAIKYISQFKL